MASANPHLEPFEFGRGWSLEALTIEMTAPRYMPLIGYAEAWSPPTSGVLTGKPIYIGDGTAEEIDRLGAVLLVRPPRPLNRGVVRHNPSRDHRRTAI